MVFMTLTKPFKALHSLVPTYISDFPMNLFCFAIFQTYSISYSSKKVTHPTSAYN